MKEISCAKARAAGLKRYFTGSRCAAGHIAERYVSSYGCVECNAAAKKITTPATRKRNRLYHEKWRATPAAKARIRNANLRQRARLIAEVPPPLIEGHCDLCGKLTKKLHWDHDHTLEALGFSRAETHRGWLCFHCNTGLGKLGDTPHALMRALRYVSR